MHNSQELSQRRTAKHTDQEVQRTPSRANNKKSIARHVRSKMQTCKDKQKIPEDAGDGEKHLPCEELMMTADSVSRTHASKKGPERSTAKTKGEKTQKPKSSQTVLKHKGEIKTFSDKPRRRELTASRLALQDVLKEELQAEENIKKGRTLKKE